MHFLYHRVRYLCLALLISPVLGACQALDSNSPAALPNHIETPDALPGGAVDQSPESPLANSIKANAQNLLNQKYPEADIKLQELHSFKTQVVAGTNYILTVSYTDQSGVQGKLTLTVYKNLEGNYALTQDNYPG